MATAPATKNVGTRFPFINLEKALGRAKELFDADHKGREMTITGAFSVWDYSEKSSGGFQTIAALKMYALVKDSNGGGKLQVGPPGFGPLWFRGTQADGVKKNVPRDSLAPKNVS